MNFQDGEYNSHVLKMAHFSDIPQQSRGCYHAGQLFLFMTKGGGLSKTQETDCLFFLVL